MIQDLCLALKGIPGHIFTQDENGNFSRFSRKEPSILFAGGEIDLLNKILELGNLRAKIYQFTSSSTGSFQSYEDIAKSALEHSIQETYEGFVNEIEEEFLQGGQITLGHIFAQYGRWSNVLETCVQLINELEDGRKKGAAVIDILENYFVLKASASSVLRQIIQSIIFVLERRFFEDLVSWYREGSVAAGFILEEREEESTDAFISSANLAYNRVPNCVSSRAANRIVAAGNWRKMIKNQEMTMNSGKEEEGEDDYTTRKLDSDIFELCEELIIGEGQLNWDLTNVEIERLDWNRLDEVTEKVFKLISSFLWNICQENQMLTKHFENIRNVYLMNRGDLFTCFSDFLAQHLTDVNAWNPYKRAWNLSCWKCGVDNYEDLFNIKVSKSHITPLENGASPYPFKSKNQLSKLLISPVIDPRLKFLFTEGHTHKCNIIYQFHGRLSVIFTSMGLDLPAEPKLFVIKRWVSGMVCHQALKLQTNWKLFQQSLEVKDLEAIMQAFEKMLHSCLRDCFFLDLELHNSYNAIVDRLEKNSKDVLIDEIIEKINEFTTILQEKEQNDLLIFLK